ncbi:MAG: carboxylesterase family protein [Polyangiales bacterium]
MHLRRTCTFFTSFTLFAVLALGAACGGDSDARPPDDAAVDLDGDAATGADAGTDAAPFESDCVDDVSSVPGLVTTHEGNVQGVAEANGVWRFLGIPFAQPPVGDLRWRAPAAPGCLPEPVFVADTFGPACPQLADGAVTGDEDCLQLNVWTPADYTADSKLPVLFFIHGGANILGSASQGPLPGRPLYTGESLAEAEGVVVVTVQYRLGPLGFLALPELSAESETGGSGHYAPLDHVAALAWVQRNIARFGGDPERVLLFGQSAGAINVCTLLVSPRAAGLFSAALMQSGFCSGVPLADAEARFDAAVDVFDECRDASDRLACLRALPAERIVGAIPGSISELTYVPVIDGHVLPDAPLALLTRGEHNDVPFALGTTADEMASDNIFTLEVSTVEEYERLIEREFAEPEGTAARILELYPAEDFATPQEALVRVYTDRAFTSGARRLARAAAASSRSPVYRYFFSKITESRAGAIPARHGIDLLYVFDVLTAIPVFTVTPADAQVADAMGGSWAALARSGDPNATVLGASWGAYDPSRDNYIDFGATVSAGAGLRSEACDFWDRLLEPR